MPFNVVGKRSANDAVPIIHARAFPQRLSGSCNGHSSSCKIESSARRAASRQLQRRWPRLRLRRPRRSRLRLLPLRRAQARRGWRRARHVVGIDFAVLGLCRRRRRAALSQRQAEREGEAGRRREGEFRQGRFSKCLVPASGRHLADLRGAKESSSEMTSRGGGPLTGLPTRIQWANSAFGLRLTKA